MNKIFSDKNCYYYLTLIHLSFCLLLGACDSRSEHSNDTGQKLSPKGVSSSPLPRAGRTPRNPPLTRPRSPAGDEYGVPGPGPGASLSLPVTRPSAQFERAYSGSEAEDYRRYYDLRHQTQREIVGWVRIGGVDLDPSQYDSHARSDYEASYTVYSEQVAQRLTEILGRIIAVNIPIRESEIFAYEDAIAEIAVANHRVGSQLNAYERIAYGFVVGDSSQLRIEVQQYLDFLREVIANRIRDLNASPQATFSEILRSGYYHNPEYPSPNGFMMHTPNDRVFMYTGTLFYNILDAVESNNETVFLQNMINLATAFHPSSIQARNGFIETYTFLFVAKRFPSAGVRQRYVHFTLACGAVY